MCIARKVVDLPFSTEQVLQRKQKDERGKGKKASKRVRQQMSNNRTLISIKGEHVKHCSPIYYFFIFEYSNRAKTITIPLQVVIRTAP